MVINKNSPNANEEKFKRKKFGLGVLCVLPSLVRRRRMNADGYFLQKIRLPKFDIIEEWFLSYQKWKLEYLGNIIRNSKYNMLTPIMPGNMNAEANLDDDSYHSVRNLWLLTGDRPAELFKAVVNKVRWAAKKNA